MQWYVLYTKSRSEQKTAQLLSRQGIEVYCPVQSSVRQWSDRKKTIEEPVFKSYVFVRLADYNKEHVQVLMTPGAVRFLWWMQKPGIVKDYEIEAIRAFLATHKDISLKIEEPEKEAEEEWAPGAQIRITRGVLKGQEATLVRVLNNKARLKLPSLGWELVAEIPVAQIEKI